MMYTCAPRDAAASRGRGRMVVKRSNKSFAVDLHCHVHTPAADEIAKQSAQPVDPTARYGNPRTAEHQKKLRAELDRKLTSVQQRLADMDRMGIDVQAISTSPLQYYYGLDSFVNGVKSLTRAEKDAIIGGNAARLPPRL